MTIFLINIEKDTFKNINYHKVINKSPPKK
jgi:hypothetical protein